MPARASLLFFAPPATLGLLLLCLPVASARAQSASSSLAPTTPSPQTSRPQNSAPAQPSGSPPASRPQSTPAPASVPAGPQSTPGQASISHSASSDQPNTRYQVKVGDTCYGIAKRILGDAARCQQIHELNPSMGPTPHALEPGQWLELPITDHPDAEVTATEKDVKAKAGQLGNWSEAAPGLAMYRGWRLRTLDASFADLRFVDTSTLSMSPNTMVVIYGSALAQQKAPARATLDHGSLRARLAQLGGKAPSLELSTPSSKARFSGGESLIEVAPDGQSRIENHGDGIAKVTSLARGGSVRLPKATGTKVKQGKRPLPPQPLPPTPKWHGASKTSFATSSVGASASGQWESVPKAVAYRIELIRKNSSTGKRETINIFQQDASDQSYHLAGLSPGQYEVTVASVDDQEFTSIPSVAHRFEVHRIGLRIDGQAQELPPDFSQPIKVPHGAKLELPNRARCVSPTIGLAHPGGLITAGTHQVQCSDSAGELMDAWTLIVEPPITPTPAPAPAPKTKRVRLLRKDAGKPKKARPRFDFGLGTSLWLLQRGQTDPLAIGTKERLPTFFFDLGLRYLPRDWVSVGLGQHVSVPQTHERGNAVVFATTAQSDFIYPKWRVSPFVGVQAGWMALVGAAPRGRKARSLSMSVELGAQAKIVGGLSVHARAGLLRMQRLDLRGGYFSLRAGIHASYRFGAL